MFKRQSFGLARRFVQADRFVFLDESGAQSNMTRLHGRSVRGTRCRCYKPHGHWKTTTMISAIRCSGVIEPATLCFDGPMNRDTFLGYTQQCLAPSLRPGEIVVMDNLASHKQQGVIDAIEAMGCDVWFLPPYSPDLNPIEMLWSKVKSYLRKAAARTFESLIQAVCEAIKCVKPDECENYFRVAGYGS